MSHLTYGEAGIVGLIQGVTELFPLSSLGHSILIPALVGGSWGNAADYVKQSLTELVLLAVLVLGVRYVMKFNLLGCFLVVFASTALGALSGLLGQDVSFYRTNAFAGLAAMLALFAWPLLAWLFSSRSSPASAASGA